jgi:hypothetical protein
MHENVLSRSIVCVTFTCATISLFIVVFICATVDLSSSVFEYFDHSYTRMFGLPHLAYIVYVCNIPMKIL